MASCIDAVGRSGSGMDAVGRSGSGMDAVVAFSFSETQGAVFFQLFLSVCKKDTFRCKGSCPASQSCDTESSCTFRHRSSVCASALPLACVDAFFCKKRRPSFFYT